MVTKIVRIGNSQGIRLSKAILDESGLSGEVQLQVRKGKVVILPATKPRKPRAGWEEECREMHRLGEDRMLDDGTPTQWDEEEWEW